MSMEEDDRGNEIEELLKDIVQLLQTINKNQIDDMHIKNNLWQNIKDSFSGNKPSSEKSDSVDEEGRAIKESENMIVDVVQNDNIDEKESEINPENPKIVTVEDISVLLDKLDAIEKKLNGAQTTDPCIQNLDHKLSSLNNFLDGMEKRKDEFHTVFSEDMRKQLSPLLETVEILKNMESSLTVGGEQLKSALETFIDRKLASLEDTLPSLLVDSVPVPGEIKEIDDNLKELKEEFEERPDLKPALDKLILDASGMKNRVEDLSSAVSALAASLQKLEGKLAANTVDYERIGKAAREQGEKQFDSINSLKSDLSGELRGLKTSNQKLENVVKEHMLETLKSETRNQTSALESLFKSLLNSALSPLGGLASLVEGLKKNLDEDNKRLYEEKENARLSAQKAESEINKFKDKIADLENKLKNGNTELSQRNDEISGLKTTLAQLRRELDNKGRELDSLRKEKENLESKNSAMSGVNKVWQNRLKLYEPVRNALLNSTFFSEFARAHDIDGDDEGLFNCMRHIGKSSDFLRQIHEFACKIKTEDKDNAKAMQPDEIEVYDALNKCYRQLMDVDFDYFVQSGDLPVTKPFVKTKFNKTNDKYMKDPIDRNRAYVKWVYVPLLKNDNNVMLKPAEVEAGND